MQMLPVQDSRGSPRKAPRDLHVVGALWMQLNAPCRFRRTKLFCDSVSRREQSVWMPVACLMCVGTNSGAPAAHQALDLSMSLFCVTLTLFDCDQKIRCGRSRLVQTHPFVPLCCCSNVFVGQSADAVGWTAFTATPHVRSASSCPPASPRKHNTTVHPASHNQPTNQPTSSTNVTLPAQSARPRPRPESSVNSTSAAPRHTATAGLSCMLPLCRREHRTHCPGAYTPVHGCACRCPKKYSTLLQHPSATQPQTAAVFGILCKCVLC